MSIRLVEANDGHYYVDDNGNRWDKEWLQHRYKNESLIEAAEHESHKLTDCKDCINCTNCINCTRCVGCYACVQCEDCAECTTCTNCIKCTFCVVSTYCHSCSLIYDCNNCMHCNGCNTLIGCIRCTNCSYSMLLEEKSDCDEYLLPKHFSKVTLDYVKQILTELEEANMLPKGGREALLIDIIGKASGILTDKEEMISDACKIEGVYERLYPSEEVCHVQQKSNH